MIPISDRAFRVGILVGALSLTSVSAVAWRRHASIPARSYPEILPLAARVASGREIIMIFVGSSTCGASQSRELPAALKTVRESLQVRAARTHSKLATLGVALDVQPNEGIQFLKKYDSFDEISVGRSWLNMTATTYIWRDLPGNTSLPQLLVITRPITVRDASIEIGPDELVVRKLGVDGIVNWAKTGVGVAGVPRLASQ